MTVDLDETRIDKNEFGFWFAWVVATTAGMLLGFLPARPVADVLGLGVAFIAAPLLAGAGWAIGYAAGLLLIQVLSSQQTAGGFWMVLVSYALFGLIIALVQWPVLRREIPQAGLWILAGVIGWTLGFSIASAVELIIYDHFLTEPWLVSLLVQGISGLIAGAVTGLALVWIVRQPDLNVVPPADKLPVIDGG